MLDFGPGEMILGGAIAGIMVLLLWFPWGRLLVGGLLLVVGIVVALYGFQLGQELRDQQNALGLARVLIQQRQDVQRNMQLVQYMTIGGTVTAGMGLVLCISATIRGNGQRS